MAKVWKGLKKGLGSDGVAIFDDVFEDDGKELPAGAPHSEKHDFVSGVKASLKGKK